MSGLRRRLQREDPLSNKQSWEEMFLELEDYKKIHGDCLVNTHETKLGRWVSMQRKRYTHGELSESQIRDLESLGFVWRLIEREEEARSWEEMFEELKAYKDEHGTCLVPTLTTKLGRWVSTQRSRRDGPKSGHLQLTEDQVARLDEIGFVWRLSNTTGPYQSWDEMYAELQEYHGQHGDCLAPRKSGKLGTWVVTQRCRRRAGELTQEQIERLDALEFAWQVNENHSWEEMYSELQEYHRQNGHCKVPSRFGKLGGWVIRQRMLRRGPQEGWKPLADEQIERLDALGFVWDAANYDGMWDEMYMELQDFSEKYGHCRVPTLSGKLGKWVKKQRECKEKPSGSNRQLTPDKIARLDAIGFAWRADENIKSWEDMYEMLREYREKNGDCLVPQSQGKLGRWVDVQRRRYLGPIGRQKQLTAEQIRVLNEIGFAWTAADRFRQLWEQKFNELKDYAEKQGHCEPPRRSGNNSQLSRWVERQRGIRNGTLKGKTPLTEEQVQRLDAIGFVWKGNKKRKRDT